MLIIPAVDIKNGRCVRLAQGKMDKETVYDEDVVAAARHWMQAGARRLHVIDLDGAVNGRPINTALIHDIVQECTIPVQVGGGIRDDAAIEQYLNAGVEYVILGTRAVTEPHFVEDACIAFPGHIIVALDCRDGKVATEGWTKLSTHSAVEVAQRFEHDGIAGIIYTDISRDGMLNTVNVEATVAFSQHVNVPVFASGGVHNLDDIHTLCAASDEGIAGVITGRAIYDGTLNLTEAQQLADKLCTAGI